MASLCNPGCLHCAISKMLMERQANGEGLTEQMIGEVCQVIADMSVSQPMLADQIHVLSTAVGFIKQFGVAITSGAYLGSAREIVDPNNVRGRRQ